MSQPRTIIIGGGIVGLSAACYLARRGAPVTLFESGSFHDSASTGNAGLVSVGHGPLPRPGLIAKAIRWMFDSASPLYLARWYDPALIRWLWQFRAACRTPHHEHCLRVLMELGHEAGPCFAALVEDERLDCEYRPRGQMDVFRSADNLRNARRELDLLATAGYESHVLLGDELRSRDPAFRDDVAGAILHTDRAFASPGKFIRDLADRARTHGAVLRPDDPVRSILTRDRRCIGVKTTRGEILEADWIILAAGVWSDALARAVGVRIPMQAGKGYHLNLSRPDPCPDTACVLAESYIAATPMDDGLRLAGTLEFSGINHRLRHRRADQLRAGASLYLHDLDDLRESSRWCGLRPCTADGLPVVGGAPTVDRLFIATGHAMMGFALGPLAGRLAAEQILDHHAIPPTNPLHPARFARA